MTKINHVLTRCKTNPKLRVTYLYKKNNDKYPTVSQYNDTMKIYPGYVISIDEGFDSSNRILIPAGMYFGFVVLFHKSLKQIQKFIHDIFPDMNKTEFEVNSMALERFITEKAMSSGEFLIVPCKWVNAANECFPALEIRSVTHGCCRIPIDDALMIDQLFQTFDPLTFGLLMLNMIGY